MRKSSLLKMIISVPSFAFTVAVRVSFVMRASSQKISPISSVATLSFERYTSTLPVLMQYALSFEASPSWMITSHFLHTFVSAIRRKYETS
jgi:hypothetical protein